jgi:hypothetical protein
VHIALSGHRDAKRESESECKSPESSEGPSRHS